MFTSYLGQFVVTSPLLVSDPCYALDTWCTHTLHNAKHGTWQAFINLADYDEMGLRVTELVMNNSDVSITDITWRKIEAVIGVDSGQCGVFDLAHYGDIDVIQGQSLWEHLTDLPWYSMCCYQTCRNHFGGVVPFGAVSRAGFGDGSYDLYVIEKDGFVVAVKIVFIHENDQEKI